MYSTVLPLIPCAPANPGSAKAAAASAAAATPTRRVMLKLLIFSSSTMLVCSSLTPSRREIAPRAAEPPHGRRKLSLARFGPSRVRSLSETDLDIFAPVDVEPRGDGDH